MAAINTGTVNAGISSPQWRAYRGKRITVLALDGSYAGRNATGELRDAERAAEVLERLLGPIDRKHTEASRVEIYLSDPLGAPANVEKPDDTFAASGGKVIVRIVQPEAPGQPIARYADPRAYYRMVRHEQRLWQLP